MIFEEEKVKQDNINIINNVISKYRVFLNREDIDYIRDYALWRAISNYDTKSSMKFSTYLYNNVRWECLKYIRDLKGPNIKYLNSTHNPSYKMNTKYTNLMIDMKESSKNLLIDRYIGNMTVEEIGKKYNFPRETIRLKLLKIIEKIKNEN